MFRGMYVCMYVCLLVCLSLSGCLSVCQSLSPAAVLIELAKSQMDLAISQRTPFVNERRNEHKQQRTNACTHARTHARTHAQTNERTKERASERTNERTNGEQRNNQQPAPPRTSQNNKANRRKSESFTGRLPVTGKNRLSAEQPEHLSPHTAPKLIQT